MLALKRTTTMLTATTTRVVVEAAATTIISAAITTILRVEIPTLQATATAIGVPAIATVTPEWETARFWKEHLVVTTPAAAAATATMVITFYQLCKKIFLNVFNGIIKFDSFFRSTKSQCQ